MISQDPTIRNGHDSATTFTHLPLELEDGKDSSKEMQCTSIMM
jgi:hypothetical protein